MDNQAKEVLGAGIAAIGTIIAAVGSTPTRYVAAEMRESLSLWGNVLQGVGNALEVDGQETISLETVGNEIQAYGNVTVIAGLLLETEEEEVEQRLIITGNWMQALGGFTALGDELRDTTAAGQLYNITGNFLQGIGNSLQAIAGIYALRNSKQKDSGAQTDEDNDTKAEEKDRANSKEDINLSLEISGSWIQAVGSVISFIGQIQEESQENEQEDDVADASTESNTDKKIGGASHKEQEMKMQEDNNA